jgi:5-hydroxyisourate hydrolase-like protein (transthyretin family)
MGGMSRRILLTFSIAIASFCLIAGSFVLRAQDTDNHHGRKYKTPPPAAHIEVLVLRDSSGKPIPQAHVIFHPIEGDRDKGSLEVKTNEDGKAIIDVIPIGDTVRLQVIADGFQTYGQDFKIDKPELSMEVRMKRPGSQVTIYKSGEAKPGKDSGSGGGSSNPPSNGQSQSQPK